MHLLYVKTLRKSTQAHLLSQFAEHHVTIPHRANAMLKLPEDIADLLGPGWLKAMQHPGIV